VEKLRERYRPKKESDWPELQRYRELLERAGLLLHTAGRFVPDPGLSAFPSDEHSLDTLLESPERLYHWLLVTAFTRLDWDSHRYIPQVPLLRNYAGFLFYALGELARDAAGADAAANHNPGVSAATPGWVPVAELADRFLAAAPALDNVVAERVEEGAKGEEGESPAGSTRSTRNTRLSKSELHEILTMAISAHFFSNFAERFGLLETRPSQDHEIAFRPTALYYGVFGA
jgi:hypothetical protein